MRLRHIILFFLMAVFVTPIRAGISTDYLLGGALTLKNGRIDKCYFEGGFARAFETSATTDRFVFYYYNQDHLGNNRQSKGQVCPRVRLCIMSGTVPMSAQFF